MLQVSYTAMQTLADFLKEKNKTKSYRDIEDFTGVNRGSVEKIINGKLKGAPDIETLARIARAYKIPLWRVIEMAGYDSGVSEHVKQMSPEEILDAIDRVDANDRTRTLELIFGRFARWVSGGDQRSDP